MKLATNFKDFPALTALFKDFQGACKPGREIKEAQHSLSDQVEANEIMQLKALSQGIASLARD